MNNKNTDSNNLAIIGATSAGKTTLAVGLYATSTEDFTVSPVGDETSKYLEIRKTSIEEGFWPAAGLAEDNVDIRLRLHASGNQVDIVFREYMGERMERDPNYIREVIGTPKSAMILFNPGMPGLSKPETRNRMLGNLKVIAQHLKDNGCIAVAFVVTASDRLTSDLAAFREDFEAYASEVTNHLTNLGLDWKRFDVTVSGQLDDQNKPKLARGENNTTHEPFLWLLKRIRDSKRRKSLLTATTVFATLLCVSGAVFGGLVVHGRQVLAKAEKAFANTTNALNIAYAAHDEATVRTTLEFLTTNSFDKVTAILPSDQTRRNELVKRVSEQSDLWRVRLLGMEFSSNKSKVEKTPLGVPLDWFEGFNNRLTLSSPVFGDAVNERDTLTNDWVNSRIELETKCQTAHFRNVVDQERKNLASAKPDALTEPLKKAKGLIEDKDRNYSLVTNRAELCAISGLITARTDAIVRYIDSKIGKPEDDKRPADMEVLCQQVGRDLKNVLTIEEFDNLSRIISVRNDEACKAWDAYHFPKRVKELEIALNAAGSNPSCPLVDSLAFLAAMTNNYPTISQVEFIKARNTIEGARKKTIEHYENLIAKGWDVNGKKPPEFDAGKIRNEILTQDAVTDDEYRAFEEDMNVRFNTAKQNWCVEQEKLVKDFSVEGDPEQIIRDYAEFFDDHSNNPFLKTLTAKVDNALQRYFRDFINGYYVPDDMNETQRRFNKFKRVCAAIGGKGMKDNPILSSPSGKFATLCCNRGNINDHTRGIYSVFDQTIRLSKIEAKVSIKGCSDNYRGLDMAVKIGNSRWDFDQKNFVIVSFRSVIDMKESSNSNGYGRIPKYSNDSWVTIWSGSPQEISFGPYTTPFISVFYEDRLNGVVSVDVSGSEIYPLGMFSKVSSTQDLPDHKIHLSHAIYDSTVGTLQLKVTGQRIGDNYYDLAKESGLIR